MKHSIPIGQLPKVFQDALLITFELGFNYRWIDSLCIIQNSRMSSDWLRESSTMDRVYRNCVCNLAATGFHDGQEGLLLPGYSRELYPPIVDFAHLWNIPGPLSYHLLSETDWNQDIISSPLRKRALVCQEQIMVGKLCLSCFFYCAVRK